MEESRKPKVSNRVMKRMAFVFVIGWLLAVALFDVPDGLSHKLSFLLGMRAGEIVLLRGHADGRQHIWSGRTYYLNDRDSLFIANAEKELKALGLERMNSYGRAIEYKDHNTANTVFISRFSPSGTFGERDIFVTIGTANNVSQLWEIKLIVHGILKRVGLRDRK